MIENQDVVSLDPRLLSAGEDLSGDSKTSFHKG